MNTKEEITKKITKFIFFLQNNSRFNEVEIKRTKSIIVDTKKQMENILSQQEIITIMFIYYYY